MKLIVGLGNIGDKYTNTRHNLGFMVLNKLAQQHDWPPFVTNKQFEAQISHVPKVIGEQKLILLKPTTMMNLSHQAVSAVARFYKLESKDIWVIYDDIDLPFGLMRVRQEGGSAGHRGVESIIAELGPDFVRFRLGIANEFRSETPADRFVLDQFTPDEQTALPQLVATAAAIVYDHLENLDFSIQTYPLLEVS